MDGADRHPKPSPDRFIRGNSVSPRKVTHIEGAAEAGDMAIKPMIVGEDMLFMEVHRAKGLVDPLHSHPDHESMCYLVSGRLRVEIDEQDLETTALERRGCAHGRGGFAHSTHAHQCNILSSATENQLLDH